MLEILSIVQIFPWPELSIGILNHRLYILRPLIKLILSPVPQVLHKIGRILTEVSESSQISQQVLCCLWSFFNLKKLPKKINYKKWALNISVCQNWNPKKGQNWTFMNCIIMISLIVYLRADLCLELPHPDYVIDRIRQVLALGDTFASRTCSLDEVISELLDIYTQLAQQSFSVAKTNKQIHKLVLIVHNLLVHKTILHLSVVSSLLRLGLFTSSLYLWNSLSNCKSATTTCDCSIGNVTNKSPLLWVHRTWDVPWPAVSWSRVPWTGFSVCLLFSAQLVPWLGRTG